MQGTRVASRYAKSFIDLTIEQGVFEQAFNDMKYILQVCGMEHELVVFLKSPVIKTDKKLAVLKELFNGKINKVTEAYIQLITNKKREKYLVEIAEEFLNQYKQKKNILTAIITSASGLDDAARKTVISLVKGNGTSEVVLQEHIDKNIIGGVIVRVGDRQVDASVSRKLSKLQRSFMEN
jgi:F-type H+-transporting ATPase subunit delta